MGNILTTAWFAQHSGNQLTSSTPSATGLAPSGPYSSIPENLKRFDVSHEGKRESMVHGIMKSFQLGVRRRDIQVGELLAGYMRIHVVDLVKMRENAHSDPEKSFEQVSKLFILFWKTKSISPLLHKQTKERFWVNGQSGNGCWLPRRDFWHGKAIFIEFLHVAIEGWRKELTWLGSKLFEYEPTASFIFVECKMAGEVDACREVGFRRVANSALFCLAKDASHISHTVAANNDAPFETQPIRIPRRKSPQF
ncbi:hypothetical protein FB45DRAFT_1098603 [Roridomyces roridus]|uniref:Uncharacterized protein n=1 Tax=Roridomyces roridus TaxID=1738132 RepID=A0AAD7CDW2_9AGAR|nr:hypothetical protein FB45DRAFT_1098603 [Roridomyces roridus]